jgi:hypothetical protein
MIKVKFQKIESQMRQCQQIRDNPRYSQTWNQKDARIARHIQGENPGSEFTEHEMDLAIVSLRTSDNDSEKQAIA